MRKSDIPAVVSTGLFEPTEEVRAFAWGRVVASTASGGYLLIVQERGSRLHTLYEYQDPEEFRADLQRVVRFPGSGGSGDAGVAAPVAPEPPARVNGAAEPLPDE